MSYFLKTKTIKFREPRNVGNEKIDAERERKKSRSEMFRPHKMFATRL